MSKKLLALDIDGTLTNTQKDITPATLEENNRGTGEGAYRCDSIGTSTAWNKEDSRHHRA